MRALRRLSLMATVAATAVCMTTAVNAQATTSGIRVRVVDEAGQAVSNVSVTIIHAPTGRVITRATNASGLLLARGLAVGGPYIVQLTQDGQTVQYQADTIEDLNLELGETESVTLVARAPGATAIEEVVVTAERLVAALRSGPGSDFSQTDIQSIPSVARDFTSTLALDPSITVDSSVPRGPAVGIAGQNFRFNTVTVDGVPQNDSFGLSFNASATQRSPISLDAIQAIQVNVAPFDVTYGNFLGGNINIVTKSGTNEFHGSAFYTYTDDSLSGDNSGDIAVDLGDFDEEIYGGTFGGPIIKDKLFFFLNYEKFETSRPANAQTLLQIAGGDSAAAAQLQADVDRARQILQDVYGFDPGPFATSDTDEDEKILVKLDWNINDNHRFVGAFQRADGDVLFDDFPDQPVLNSNRYNINERLNSYSFQLFSDWTDNFSTELKIGFKDVKNRQRSVDSSTPEFSIGPINAGGDRFRQANELDSENRLFKFKADYTTGNHTITAGFEQDNLEVVNTFLPFSRGQIFFNSLDDLENRQIGALLFGGSNSGVREDAIADFEIDTNTIYVQDEWAATDTLTLKFGLRYDWINNSDEVPLNPRFVERNGFANTENLDGKDLIAPRFGFNWDATDRLTVRGGAGLFGGGTPIIFLSNSYAANGTTRSFAEFFATFLGTPQSLFDAVAANLPSPTAVAEQFQNLIPTGAYQFAGETEAIDPNFDLLSSWKYNLGFDYTADLSSIGLGDDWDLSLDFTYTAVKDGYNIREGRREQIGTAPDGRPIYNNTSLIPPENGFFFFNAGDYIVENTSRGSSTVIAANLKKEWDTDYGLFGFRAGYTFQDVEDERSYSRFVAFETFSFDPQADLNNPDLATSLFEIRHRLTAQLSWEKAIFGDNMTRLSLFYSGRSGRPASFVFGGNDQLPFGGNALADDGFQSGTAGSNLFYVPTGLNDPLVTGDADFLAALDGFISGESCLNDARGSIVGRNACRSSWVNSLDLAFSQEVEVFDGHVLELQLNIENFGNLIDSSWGRDDPWTLNAPSNLALATANISDDGSQFIYTPVSGDSFVAPQQAISQISSVYRIQFGVRYRF